MGNTNQYVVFTLDAQQYALPLPVVEGTTRAVEVTPLPQAPEVVLGVANVQGQIIPVVNTRHRFGLPERKIDLTDQFIIAHTTKRAVVLVTDAVNRVIEHHTQGGDAAEAGLPEGDSVSCGVINTNDGMIFIHDLDAFLSLEEEASLDAAMSLS